MRQGPGELLLSAVYIYPFRCQLCAHRFLRVEFGRRYNESTVDKREYERVPTKFTATFVGDKERGAGTVTRLSLGGCALESPVRMMEGMIFNLRLQPTDVSPAIMIETTIVRSVRPPVAGLEFLRTNATEQFRLIQYVAGLLTAHRMVE